ncbi:hypothetical protein M8C21_013113 [Ambrosia artemisiifolia]|uniref:Beta-amylase n=1 Tax=Ambrosia artemisiifolia TaxID=4212 RepID=A0AAD5GWT5_AMBAR|nr:hypothetical protein M8C21_013113 [Ambrosia artemisiifolia]
MTARKGCDGNLLLLEFVVMLYKSFANMSRTTPASYRASSSQDEDTYPIVDEWDFTGTTRVPVYVKLPSKIIDKECELVDPHYLTNLLTTLKSINVDGVTVYFDYMRSFWHEFNEFFQDGSITIIQIGELRYPSNPAKHGWKYRGIGEFQCFIDHGDRVLAKARLAFEGAPISVKVGVPLVTSKSDGEFRVLNAAWDADIPVASECALAPESYGFLTSDKILEHSKPRNDLDRRHSSAFTYTGPAQALLEQHNFKIFQIFVKRMHGEAVEAT